MRKLMRIVVGRSAFVKLFIVAAVGVIIGAVALMGDRQSVLASAFGPLPSVTGAPGEGNCAACHSSFPLDSGSGSVAITGVPAGYAPGQQLTITVTTSQEDAVIYGFQLTAIDSSGQGVGTFTLPVQSEPRAQIVLGNVGANLMRRYVQHTSEGLSNGQFGFNSWTFTWTAPTPATGRVDFYAAGNAANSDNSTSGDYIYTTSASTSPGSSLVSLSGKVTTPSGLALRNAKVILTGAGNVQRTATTSSFGLYSFADVPSGQAYTVTAVSKRYRFSPQALTPTGNLANVDFIGLE